MNKIFLTTFSAVMVFALSYVAGSLLSDVDAYVHVIFGSIVIAMVVILCRYLKKIETPLPIAYQREDGSVYVKSYLSFFNRDNIIGIVMYGDVFALCDCVYNEEFTKKIELSSFIRRSAIFALLSSNIVKFNKTIVILCECGVVASPIEMNRYYYISEAREKGVFVYDMNTNEIRHVDEIDNVFVRKVTKL